jgi:dihydroorotate dehydrogenase (NAD+) catalytic subunit
MIDLAPGSKHGLELRGPIILAGGYGGELGPELVSRANALVTLPTSLRPHVASRSLPRIFGFPGGFLYERGGSNPGLAAVFHSRRLFWKRLGIPLILSLAYADVTHWGEIAERASHLDEIAGLELEMNEDSDVKGGVNAVRAHNDLPLILKLTLERADEQAKQGTEAGADALTVGHGPRGICTLDGRRWEGRLGGPAVKPLTLRALARVRESFPEVPLIAAGGAYSAADVKDYIEEGASAVQIETAIWRDPQMLSRLDESLFRVTPRDDTYPPNSA